MRYRIGLAALGLALAMPASAAVVFQDDFTSRPDGQEIFNTAPASAASGVGTYQHTLTGDYAARIDPFAPAPIGKTLKFTTSVGSDPQMVYLPWSYDGSDRLELTLRAAYETLFNLGDFNNFAIGFAAPTGPGGSWVFTDHVLVQNDQLVFFLDGTASAPVAFDFSGFTYYTFVFGYDPSLAGIPGAQPFSLTINGSPIAIPTLSAAQVYDPIESFGAVAFGSRFSPGNTNRYASEFGLQRFEVSSQIPAPGSVALLVLGAALLGLASSRMRIAGRHA